MMGFTPRLLIAAILCLPMFVAVPALAEPVAVEVASDHRASLPVVLSPQASEQSRAAAEELADYLGRITGAAFQVREGDGSTGLVVGAFSEFPELALDELFDPTDPFRREEYVLRSHSEGIYLIGATAPAARLAVWDLLYRLGHRQFFPGETWEVIPSRADVTIAVDVLDGPDYYAREVWSGGTRWDFAEEPFRKWRVRNRNELDGERDVDSSFDLNTGHAYGRIINANQKAFDQHPEYYALIDGKREYIGGNTKFCILSASILLD